MAESEHWYIVKQADGSCNVLSDPVTAPSEPHDGAPEERWGPFESQAVAIARRVGLIRAGKCQPK